MIVENSTTDTPTCPSGIGWWYINAYNTSPGATLGQPRGESWPNCGPENETRTSNTPQPSAPGTRRGRTCPVWRRNEGENVKLSLTIDMDNAAFEECNGAEVARILEEYASGAREWVFVGGERKSLHDINGNKVGKVEVTE